MRQRKSEVHDACLEEKRVKLDYSTFIVVKSVLENLALNLGPNSLSTTTLYKS